MGLPSSLISEFAKITNDNKPQNNEVTVYGTVKMVGGKKYVMLDGSDQLTPITSTVDIKYDEASETGDRVIVTLKNHTATVTGNITSPAARKESVDILTTYEVKPDELAAIMSSIDALKTIIENMKSSITTIEFETFTAKIQEMEAKYADIDHLSASQLEAINADIENLTAIVGSFTEVSTEDLEAVNANIQNLKVYNGNFTYFTAYEVDAKKADIDFANVKNLETVTAVVRDLLTAGEIITQKQTAEQGVFTDYLTGVRIHGDVIDANTLKAKTIILEGEDGLFYQLNADAKGLVFDQLSEADQEKYSKGLDGSVIIAKTITANQISVSDLMAFRATIGGFFISDGGNNIIKRPYVGVTESWSGESLTFTENDDGTITVNGEGDAVFTVRRFILPPGTYKLSGGPNVPGGNTLNLHSLDFSFSVNDMGEGVTFTNPIEQQVEVTLVIMRSSVFDNYIVDPKLEAVGDTNPPPAAIYSAGKPSVHDGSGVYLDSSGQMSVGDVTKFIKYYEDENGLKHLDISTDHMRLSTIGDKPCLELGSPTGQHKQILTDTETKFMDGTVEAASIGNQALNIGKANIKERLAQSHPKVSEGHFEWTVRANGHYGLSWKED